MARNGHLARPELRRFADRAKFAAGRCRWQRFDPLAWVEEHPGVPPPHVEHGFVGYPTTAETCEFCSQTFFRSYDLGTTGVEMEVQRPALVFAQRLVIQLAEDMARHIPHDQTNDFLVDSILAPVERVPNCFIERSR